MSMSKNHKNLEETYHISWDIHGKIRGTVGKKQLEREKEKRGKGKVVEYSFAVLYVPAQQEVHENDKESLNDQQQRNPFLVGLKCKLYN